MLIPRCAEFIAGHVKDILRFRECLQRAVVRQIRRDNLHSGFKQLLLQSIVREAGNADYLLVQAGLPDRIYRQPGQARPHFAAYS
ncbi:hypothetical protein D3C79_968960 [compost metagenome]